MRHRAFEINGMTGVLVGLRRSRSIDAASGSAGMSVSNLLKALIGAPIQTKMGSSDER